MTAPPKGARAPRVSKADATDRFVGAVIDLLVAHPVAEISDQLIADTAGINRASIYRYFGTRDELLDAVLVRLTSSWAEEAVALAERREAEQKAIGAVEITARITPLSRPMFEVAAYLVARNHRSTALTLALQTFLDIGTAGFERVGMTPRMARATALKSLALQFSRAAITGVFDLPDSAIADVQALVLTEAAAHTSTAEALGWLTD